MEFEKIYEEVDKQLNNLSLEEKVNILNEVLHVPVIVDNGKFYHFNNEYDECRMRDLIDITQRWLNLKEYEKLQKYFENKKPAS